MTISAVGKKGSGRLTVIINVPTKGEACERITIYGPEVHMFLDLLKGSADREYRNVSFICYIHNKYYYTYMWYI